MIGTYSGGRLEATSAVRGVEEKNVSHHLALVLYALTPVGSAFSSRFFSILYGVLVSKVLPVSNFMFSVLVKRKKVCFCRNMTPMLEI